jgi:hypothetical protein
MVAIKLITSISSPIISVSLGPVWILSAFNKPIF